MKMDRLDVAIDWEIREGIRKEQEAEAQKAKDSYNSAASSTSKHARTRY
jgi:hypothetical protein